MTDFSSLLSGGLTDLGLERLSGDATRQLECYAAELGKWGKKINLVAKAPFSQIVETHFLDSLTLLPVLAPWLKHKGSALLDVGSGAGFPGLVLKIACPELPVTLLEPRQKRAVFLRHVVRTLGLEGVEVINDRLDDGQQFTHSYGYFPLMTCRALTDISEFLAMAAGVSPAGGHVICMKGPQADDELATWRQHSIDSPFVVVARHEFELPSSKAARVLVVFEKRS